MSQPIRGQGGYPIFLISTKNASLVEDVEDLASCQVLLNFIQRFQRKSWKCLSKSYDRGGHFVSPIHLKNTNLVEGVEILLPIKFRRIPFSGLRGEGRKCLCQSEARAANLFFPDWPEKHKRGRRHWDLASCQVSLNSIQRFLQRSWKCLSQSEARAAILFFRSARKTQTW